MNSLDRFRVNEYFACQYHYWILLSSLLVIAHLRGDIFFQLLPKP